MSDTIEETIEAMELLVQKQDQTLKVANEIITMKNRMIELCELELELYKTQIKRQLFIITVLSALVTITTVFLIAGL